MGRGVTLSSNLKAQQTLAFHDLRAGHESPLWFKMEERRSDGDCCSERGREYTECVWECTQLVIVHVGTSFNFTMTVCLKSFSF